MLNFLKDNDDDHQSINIDDMYYDGRSNLVCESEQNRADLNKSIPYPVTTTNSYGYVVNPILIPYGYAYKAQISGNNHGMELHYVDKHNDFLDNRKILSFNFFASYNSALPPGLKSSLHTTSHSAQGNSLLANMAWVSQLISMIRVLGECPKGDRDCGCLPSQSAPAWGHRNKEG